MRFNLDKLLLFILPSLSLVLCLIQSKYIYDGFHWGLNAVIAENILSNKKIYQDFFIHYSLLPNFIQAFFYKLSNQNVLSLIISSSIFFSFGNFLLSLLVYKKTNLELAIFSSVILFLLHPFPIYPWHNYYFFCFLICGIYLILEKNNFFLAGIFFGMALLCYENFIFVCLISLLNIILINLYFYHKANLFNFKKFKFLLGFLIILLPFYYTVFSYVNIKDWLEVFTLNNFFLELYNLNYLTLVLNFFLNYFKKLTNFFNAFSYIIFLIFFIINIVFIFYNIFKKKNLELILLSLFSCSLLITSLHDVNVFRLSTGFSLSIIIVFILLHNKDKKLHLIFLTLFLFGNILSYENDSNKFIPKSYYFSEFKNKKNLNFFRNQVWQNDTWVHLTKVEELKNKIKNNCNLSSLFFVNHTLDAYYFLIFNNFKSFQYLPWYNNDKIRLGLMKKFNQSYENKLIYFLKNNKIIMIIDNYNLININKIPLDTYKVIKLPYSYQNKSKVMLLPNKCFEKFNL